MKKIIGLLSCLLVIAGLRAQTSGQIATYTPGVGAETDGLYLYAMGSISDKLEKLDYNDRNIEGSPYHSNTFEAGKLYYGDELAGEIYYRYNAYNEEVEIRQRNSETEPIRGLGKDKKIRLVAKGKSMSFKTFIDKRGNTKNGYLTLLSDGEYKLYKHLRVTFKEAKKAENSLVKGSPAKFSQSTVYFLESPDGKRIEEVQLSNKKLLDLVNKEQQVSLKQFLKENNIKINNEADLYQVLNFLNS